MFLSGGAAQDTISPGSENITITNQALIYDVMITGEAVLRAIRIARNNEKPITKLISGELVTKIEHEGEDIIACQMPPYLTNAAN